MSEEKKIIFGTDGWRGLLDSELNPVNVSRVAQAFADYINNKGSTKKIAIGFDGRKHSAEFAGIFAEVLNGNHLEVLLSDRIIPTPLVSFACLNQGCDAGVMITASHNPPQYNGIKFKSAAGSPFFTEDTAEVESLIDQRPPTFKKDGIQTMDFTAAYLQHIENLVDFSIIKKTGLRVAIDSMAGAGGNMLENILKSHGIHAETINGIPQADFGGRLAEPIAQNLGPLADFLKKGNFSLGLATDGDADRLGVMDEQGNFMNIQETILYLAQHVKKYRRVAGPLVKTASVTDKLLQIFPKHENMLIDVQVGFKYVAEAMLHSKAAFGAEESGGFGFKEHLPERDGIYSALMFLEMMAAAGKNSLKAFINEKRKKCGEIFYDRIDVINDNPSRHEVLPLLGWHPPSYLGNFQILSTQSYINSRGKINGLKLRLDGNPRWLLIRVSETEPMVRIYAEAENNDEIPVLLGSGKKLFEEYLQKPKTFNQ